MILNAIHNAIKKAKQRGWETIYIAVDIHDTIVEGNYQTNNIPTTFYPYAKHIHNCIRCWNGEGKLKIPEGYLGGKDKWLNIFQQELLNRQ